MKKRCLSTLGKSEVDSLRYLTDFQSIVKLTGQTSEFLHIITEEKSFPVSYFFDVRESIKKLSLPASYLSEAEFFEMKRSFQTIKSILNFFNSDEDDNYPLLREEAKEVQFFDFVTDSIDKILDSSGRIKDNASPGLQKVRQELVQKEASISGAVKRVMRRVKSENLVDSDSELTVRDGRMLIPIPAAAKRKIKGIVYDESASGKTAYIEPLEVVELNNAVRELYFAERREIIKVLAETTDKIRPYADDLALAYLFLAKIDLTRAKALLARDLDAQAVEISEKSETDFYNVRHPLLVLAYNKQERYVVPAMIRINEEERIILVSGPNAGGKSVVLKTMALNQFMVQSGLLPVADSNSVVGVYASVFIDIGDEQSIENDLSTYSSHLHNLKFFSEHADNETLVLMDEFGTGTEPMFGGAIAEAVLEELNNKKIRGIVTTHYGNLKQFADDTPGIVNAAMLYDNRNMRPLYVLETGVPGSSFAFEIAQKIGLPDNIMKNAETKLDQNRVDFESLLKQTQNDKRLLNRQKRKLRAYEKELSGLQNSYENKLNELLEKEKKFLQNIKKEEKEILATANRRIENAIFRIKKSNADKEETKKIRSDLQSYIDRKENARKEEEEKILRKIDKIKNRKQKRKQNKKKDAKNEPKEKNIKKGNFEIGDRVLLEGQNVPGEIMSLKKNKAVVAFGQLRTETDISRLKHSKKKPEKNKSKGGVKIYRHSETEASDFLGNLDIRGKRGEDALNEIIRYIDDALAEGRSEIKILHGTGDGILKRITRNYLHKHSEVVKFSDERIDAGGSGITVIRLKN